LLFFLFTFFLFLLPSITPIVIIECTKIQIIRVISFESLPFTRWTVWITGDRILLIRIRIIICIRVRSTLGVDHHDHQQHQGGDQGRHGGLYVVTLVVSWVSTVNQYQIFLFQLLENQKETKLKQKKKVLG